jgi:hypothetical protein
VGFLGFVADGLWVVALAIMAAATLSAWRRVEPGARVPVLFDRQGKARWRLSRTVALWLPPALGFALSLLLLWAHRVMALDAPQAVIIFGVRATLAASFALADLAWLRMALAALAAESALKPWDTLKRRTRP